MTQSNRPSTDSPNPEEQILELLAVLRRAGEITEVRGLIKSPDGRRAETHAGYFADTEHHALVAASLFFDREFTPTGIYIVLNSIMRIPHGGHTKGRIVRTRTVTTDKDVFLPCLLLLDIDSILAVLGGMATDSEKSAALALAYHIACTLAKEYDWHALAVIDSGNGVQMIMQLPDDISVIVRKRILNTLADRFDTPSAKVDRTTYNPSRLARLPGTWNRKGKNLSERPHRQAQLLHVNTSAKAISAEHLEALIGDDTGSSRPAGTGPRKTRMRFPRLR